MRDLLRCNETLKAAANVVKDSLGIKVKENKAKNADPWWRKRSNAQINVLRKELLIMKRGKLSKSKGIKIPSGEVIKEIDTENGYNYLGVLEAVSIKDREMKTSLKREYLRTMVN